MGDKPSPTYELPGLLDYLPDAFAAILRDDPARMEAVDKEVAWVASGAAKPVELSLDPVSAFALGNAVQVALTRLAPTPASREPLERIVAGIESEIRKQCPELASLLAQSIRLLAHSNRSSTT